MTRDQLLGKRAEYVEKIRELDQKQDGMGLPWARNVVATGIGMKISREGVTDGPCLVLLVRKKVEDEYLQDYSITKFLPNADRDVVEIGSFQPAAAPRLTSPHSLDSFVSIGDDLSMASSQDHATLCAFALGDPNDGYYFLSAQHGIDGHHGLFKLVVSGGGVIGTISRESNLLPGDCLWEGNCSAGSHDHQLDAVACKLGKGFVPRFALPGGGRLNPTVGDPYDYIGDEVRKASGTVSTGILHCTDLCATIDYPSETACLRGQFLIRHKTRHGGLFASRGDSGSLIVSHAPDTGTADRHTALGILVAVGDPVSLLGENQAGYNYSIATPIGRILDEFNLDLAVG